MIYEIEELKKIVAEFTLRLDYEAQQFQLKFNQQVDLILLKTKQKISNVNQCQNTTENAMAIDKKIRMNEIAPDDKYKQIFIYPKDVAKLLGVSTTKFYELNKLPEFPKPCNPLGKRPMYIRSEIEAWAMNLRESTEV